MQRVRLLRRVGGFQIPTYVYQDRSNSKVNFPLTLQKEKVVPNKNFSLIILLPSHIVPLSPLSQAMSHRNVVREESRHREKKGGSQVTARARERERRRYSM